ncbi:protein FAM167B [Protopterus annectens]|uniref:protein FAM167B n=1 Tax=Protopterus annectens TaxID=7888 RepID=UPI001CFB993A|nr:protein FAM167B [Protopterus annectens]
MSIRNLEFKELGEEELFDNDDLDSVKALTAKLKLQTRRPSYLEWKAHVQNQSWRNSAGTETVSLGLGLEKDGSVDFKEKNQNKETTLKNICGFDSIDQALEWLRKELREMQALDHQLARQLMKLRYEIHKVKVEQVCHEHKEMLDDATFGLEGCGEDSDLLCDIPLKAAFTLSMPLKHIGVTRMNINSRRFSLC